MKKETTVLGKQFSEDKKPKSTAGKSTKEYINNPFFITLKGLGWLFNRAKGIAIVLLVLSLLGGIGNFATRSSGPNTQDPAQLQQDQSKFSADIAHTFQSISTEAWLLIALAALVALLIFVFVCFWIGGAVDYTAAKLAKGETVTIGGALKAAWRRLGSYAWVQVIVGVKIFLWSLLLLIPGIIMAVRYSLAGTAFFAEDLKGNQAVKRSLALTKGAWITTFATSIVFNVVTLGLLSVLVDVANKSALYRQLADAGSTKPAPHWLSKLTLALIIIFIGVVALIITAVVAYLASSH